VGETDVPIAINRDSYSLPSPPGNAGIVTVMDAFIVGIPAGQMFCEEMIPCTNNGCDKISPRITQFCGIGPEYTSFIRIDSTGTDNAIHVYNA
jgi:hypothetical protein